VKGEVLYRFLWGDGLERVYGPVVRQTSNEYMNIYCSLTYTSVYIVISIYSVLRTEEVYKIYIKWQHNVFEQFGFVLSCYVTHVSLKK
jgi:hypothetical protein